MSAFAVHARVSARDCKRGNARRQQGEEKQTEKLPGRGRSRSFRGRFLDPASSPSPIDPAIYDMTAFSDSLNFRSIRAARRRYIDRADFPRSMHLARFNPVVARDRGARMTTARSPCRYLFPAVINSTYD